MDENMPPVRLVWSDEGGLESRAVSLACTGTTQELEAHLELLRRRGALEMAASSAEKNPNSA
jgi:hypothetical protein